MCLNQVETGTGEYKSRPVYISSSPTLVIHSAVGFSVMQNKYLIIHSLTVMYHSGQCCMGLLLMLLLHALLAADISLGP